MVQGAPIVPIRGEFVWSQTNCADADEASTGGLRLFVGGRLIWGSGGRGVHWHWVDLLEGMARSWPDLLYGRWLEGLAPKNSSVFASIELYEEGVRFQGAVDDRSEDDVISSLGEVYDWIQDHFLSRFMPGLDVPDVAVWADGANVFFQTDQFSGGFPRTLAVGALSELGNSIDARLRACGFGDHPAALAWRARRVPAADRYAATLVGYEPGRLALARGSVSEAEAWGDDAGDMSVTVWSAAAAACRGAQAEVLKDVFQALAGSPSASGSWLDLLDTAGRVRQAVGSNDDAYGLELAREARGIADAPMTGPLGIENFARVLGLSLIARPWDITGPTVIAVHKPGDAPAIFLNSNRLSLSNERERRWLVVLAVSKIHSAALREDCYAERLDIGGESSFGDRLAREVLVPSAALEEFILSAGPGDAFRKACQHFGAPAGVVATQLMRSQALQMVPPEMIDRARAVQSSGAHVRQHRHLRIVA